MMKKIMQSAVIILAMTFGIIFVPNNSKAAEPSLINTFGSAFGRIGTCINNMQLRDGNLIKNVKANFNSITMENEMKPDAILGGWNGPTIISKSEAEKRGYFIPSNYTDNGFPSLNFSTVDSVMRTCYDNGIGLRGHTLAWHAQTPAWFFRENYNSNGSYVSKSVMNARLEFYVKSVLYHVYKNQSQYASCVYAWDVVNEHFHAAPNTGWITVYNEKGSTQSEYISNAFKYAYEALEDVNLAGSVKLFYNDYNEYDCVNDIISLFKFVNKNKKYCDGVGMQSHLATNYPSVDHYLNAVKSFLNAGLEVQITEMDIGNSSESEQANYVYNMWKQIFKIKKDGGNISAVVFWGLSDQNSWRGQNKPLLFSNTNVPKQSFYKAVQAYSEVYGSETGPTPGPVRVSAVDPSKITPSPKPTEVPVNSTAIFTDSQIVIDGKGEDTAWASATAKPVSYYSGTKGNTTATAKLLWDKKNLYVLVDVVDSSIDKSASDDWLRDGIELFFDEDNSKEYSYSNNDDAFQFRFTGLSKTGTTALTSSFESTGSSASSRYSALKKNIKYAATTKGYTVECAIPFYKTPTENKICGFELTVMDCQSGTRKNEIWLNGPSKNNMYQDPSLFGTLKLVSASGSNAPAKATNTPKPTEKSSSGGNKDVNKDTVSTPDPNVVSAPMKVKAVYKKGKVKVKWTKNQYAIKYVVYRSKSKNGTYVKLKTVKTNKFYDKKYRKKGKNYYRIRTIQIIQGKQMPSALSSAAKAKKTKAKK